jgi:hypothetical protein
MKWWLIIQVLATWPQSPQPLQIQGPFDTKELCDTVKEQFDTFAIKSKCISVQQPAGTVK